MIELYHNDMSVCAEKVRFALAEKAIPWTSHHLNLRAGDQQKPEYLKLNPNALVPTLVDNGTVIIESTVINEYLDDAYPELRLRPREPRRGRACGFGQSSSMRACTRPAAWSARQSHSGIKSWLTAWRPSKNFTKRCPIRSSVSAVGRP